MSFLPLNFVSFMMGTFFNGVWFFVGQSIACVSPQGGTGITLILTVPSIRISRLESEYCV